MKKVSYLLNLPLIKNAYQLVWRYYPLLLLLWGTGWAIDFVIGQSIALWLEYLLAGATSPVDQLIFSSVLAILLFLAPIGLFYYIKALHVLVPSWIAHEPKSLRRIGTEILQDSERLLKGGIVFALYFFVGIALPIAILYGSPILVLSLYPNLIHHPIGSFLLPHYRAFILAAPIALLLLWATRYILAIPVFFLEKLSPRHSLSRSVLLTQGKRISIFLTILASGTILLPAVYSIMLSLPLFFDPFNPFPLDWSTLDMAYTIASAAYYPLISGVVYALLLLFYSQYTRKA